MRVHQFFSRSFLSLSLLAAATIPAHAVEYALSTYALGESAFSAGVTPPPGTYVTAVAAYYSSKIGTAVDFGGVTLNAGANSMPSAVALTCCTCPIESCLAATSACQ